MRAFLALPLLCLPVMAAAQNLTFTHDGVVRQYLLHKPARLPADAPLVFVLHGHTGTGAGMPGMTGMDSLADAHGFVVCYPQGLPDAAGKTHWNAELRISTVDDIGFLSRLARNLQVTHGLSARHTFAIGMSNGGFMSYTLASDAPDVFRAAAPVAGLMSADTWRTFASKTPVPICHIHGTADPVVPADGSMTTAGGWGGGPSVDSLEAFWTRFNRCAALETKSLGATAARYHRKGIGGNEVWFFRVAGLDHRWPKAGMKVGIDAGQVAWEFFARLFPQRIRPPSTVFFALMEVSRMAWEFGAAKPVLRVIVSRADGGNPLQSIGFPQENSGGKNDYSGCKGGGTWISAGRPSGGECRRRRSRARKACQTSSSASPMTWANAMPAPMARPPC